MTRVVFLLSLVDMAMMILMIMMMCLYVCVYARMCVVHCI